MTWTKARFLALNLTAAGLLAAGTTLSAGPGDDPAPAAAQPSPNVAEDGDPLARPFTIEPPGDLRLGQALDLVADQCGLKLAPCRDLLEAAGVEPDTPLRLGDRIRGVQARDLLKIILTPVGLTFSVHDGVLQIHKADDPKPEMVTRVYSVGDLVIPAAQVAFLNSEEVRPSPMPRPEFEPLIDLITSSVAPGCWAEPEEAPSPVTSAKVPDLDASHQPPDGSITPFYLNASLIIRQTPAVHDEVVQRLRQLRRLRGLRIPEEAEAAVEPPGTLTTLKLDRAKGELRVTGPARLRVTGPEANPAADVVASSAAIVQQASPAANSITYTFHVADLLERAGFDAGAKARQLDALVQLLTATVAPGTWRDRDENGHSRVATDPDQPGEVAISADRSYLRITHRPEVVEAVRNWLDLLRTIGGTRTNDPVRAVPPPAAVPALAVEPARPEGLADRLDHQERRLQQIEQKLDRLIDALDSSVSRPADSPRR